MFGRFGIVLIMIAVLACAGVFSGVKGVDLQTDASIVPGAVIMIAALVLTAFAKTIAGKMPEDRRQNTEIIIKLGAVALCGIGAIVVFCG